MDPKERGKTQGKLLPPRLERQVNTGSQGLPERRRTVEIAMGTKAWLGKPYLELTNSWKLSVDKPESEKLQGNPVIGGSHTSVSFISTISTKCSQYIEEKKVPHASSRRRKGIILKYDTALSS